MHNKDKEHEAQDFTKKCESICEWASCTMGTGSFSGVKSGRGVMLTPHPFLVPWSRKGRAIPLLPLWAVRPVQSLSACTRVHFTFTFICEWRLLYEADIWDIGEGWEVSDRAQGIFFAQRF